MTDVLLLDEDEFDQQYPLKVNHLDPNATWALGDGRGHLFGLSDAELAFVRSQPVQTIWTLLDCDEGLVIGSGYHWVNRLGYLISTVPVPDGVDVEVLVEEYSDREGNDHE